MGIPLKDLSFLSIQIPHTATMKVSMNRGLCQVCFPMCNISSLHSEFGQVTLENCQGFLGRIITQQACIVISNSVVPPAWHISHIQPVSQEKPGENLSISYCT